MNVASMRRRIERLEARRPKATGPRRVHQIVVDDANGEGEEARQLAALRASGDFHEGDDLIVLRIVDPPREAAENGAAVPPARARPEPGPAPQLRESATDAAEPPISEPAPEAVPEPDRGRSASRLTRAGYLLPHPPIQ